MLSIKKSTQLLFACVLVLGFQSADSKEIVISPTQSEENCVQDGVECLSLSRLYVDSEDKFELSSNTTILFMKGIYLLRSNIMVRDLADVTLTFQEESELLCENGSSLVFVNITNLQMIGLTVTNCGTEITEGLIEEVVSVQTEGVLALEPGIRAAVFAVNIRNLHMDRVKINGSHGYGFLGINIVGKSLVNRTLINGSNTQSSTDYCTTSTLTPSEAAKCLGGNALFVYSDFRGCPATRDRHSLTVSESTFSHGFEPTGGFQFYVSRGCGLGVSLTQKYYDVEVKLLNSTFANNTARSFGSNLYIRLMEIETTSSVAIHNCRFVYGNSFRKTGVVSTLVFLHGLLSQRRNENSCPNTSVIQQSPQLEAGSLHRQILLIEGSEFLNNFGGAIFAFSFTNLITISNIYGILIRSCIFRNNSAVRGSALYVSDLSSQNIQLLEMTIENTSIDSHTTVVDKHSGVQSSTNIITSVKNITFRNSVFTNNNNSAILSYDSNIYFEGQNVFRNNSAPFGGAMHLTGNSIIYVRPNTEVILDGNSARKRGGAIYLTGGSDVAFFFNCQIQIFDPTFTEESKLNITMQFVNNTAIEAGDALYGGRIDLCYPLAPSSLLYMNDSLVGTVIFDTITNFTHQRLSNSLIASDAFKICFCFQGVHNCSVKNMNVSKFPGENFDISVIGLGQRDGAVPAVVQLEQLGSNNVNIENTDSSCTNASYKVLSNKTTEHLRLSVDNIRVRTNSLLVTVNLLSCNTHVGFSFDSERGVCDCDERLKERNMECDINNRVIRRQPPYWLGNYSNHLLLHDNCPYDYCKTTSVQIVMSEPNISDQCAFDRYGILCGSCRQGLSQVFGTSRCLECSNIHLLLIIPFALAGIALVAFLFVFNLTVSVGTINGLIFYANILKINESTFFLTGHNIHFKVFISWLNLDLGIETCFYNGMDSLGKTWLQFVFPFYLWAIVFVIILLSRYSRRLTKLCGNNSVSVLATIFLLSFTKLQRTVTRAVSLNLLDYPEGPRAVWTDDGNLLYARKSHLALLIFSLTYLLAIALPFALLILFVQCLRRFSDKKLLRWVNKLMPIFDAYLGPYKPNQGYWTGLLLFVKVILVIAFVGNVSGYPAIDIFVVSVVGLFLIMLNLGQGGVYRKTFLTYLEISYVVNLLLLAVATALVMQIDGKQRPSVIYSSATVAFVTFVGTLAYHVKIKLEKLTCIQRISSKWRRSRAQWSFTPVDSVYVKFEDGVPHGCASNRKSSTVTTTVISGISESSKISEA